MRQGEEEIGKPLTMLLSPRSFRFLARSAALLALIAVAGCSDMLVRAYPGPELPSSEVALIEAKGVRIVKANGTEVGEKYKVRFGPKVYELAPGYNFLLVERDVSETTNAGMTVNSGIGSSTLSRTYHGTLGVPAEPGKRYRLLAGGSYNAGTGNFWIEDAESGSFISGAKPIMHGADRGACLQRECDQMRCGASFRCASGCRNGAVSLREAKSRGICAEMND